VTHFAYRRGGLALVLAVSISGALACTAGVRATGTTGTGGSSSSTTGSGGSVATGGSPTGAGGSGAVLGTGGVKSGGDIGLGGSPPNPDAAACQQMEIPFVQTNPTVYLLVDRSGSMFHCLSGNNTGNVVCDDQTNTSWTHLKTAIEQVLPTLDSQVRFGFTTVWGTDPSGSGGMCPSLKGMLTDNVSPALNNAAAIKKVYDGLAFPPVSTAPGMKFESPASESLDNVTKALLADTTTGDKYIIFITDGQPDYCDDSNSLCAPDSVVWKLQAAYAAGIKTIVMGIQTALFDLAPGVLQSWANAGAGENTIAPVRTGGMTTDFYDQCDGITGWKADLTASGQTPMRGDTLGLYSATSGPTMPSQPNAADTTALTTALTSALSGVRSCTFDLSSFQIYTDDLSGAIVYMTDASGNKTNIPFDTGNKNGWDMIDAMPVTVNGMTKHIATQLELFGSSCDMLQSPNTAGIKFNFPCEVIITIN
jgi:hypothetical protein